MFKNKTKIKALDEDGKQFYPQTHIKAIIGLGLATEKLNGLMSKEDKQKLNNLNGTGANSGLGSVFYTEVIINGDYTD